MNRVTTLAGVGVLLLGGVAVTVRQAQSQSAKGVVILQPTSPGTAQVGHSNVNGSVRGGNFANTNLGSTGFTAVLTAPSSINPALFLTSPILATTSTGNGIVSLTSGSGSCGVLGSAISGAGVCGRAGGAGAYGIEGQGNGLGLAGYFNGGNVQMTGNLGVGVAPSAFPLQFASTLGDKISLYGNTGAHYGLGIQSGTLQIHADAVGGDIAFGYGTSAAMTETMRVHGNGNVTIGTTFQTAKLEVLNTTGRAIRGVSTAASFFPFSDTAGVVGEGSGSGRPGVVGFSDYVGMLGYSNSTSGYAIFGRNDQTGASAWAVYASGRFGASGTKSFRIDHPEDPTNKYLLHYCSEGPEPLNVYSGNVTTDAKGYATVQMPSYFADINKDFRYQLTVIDTSDDFVMAKVASEIENNEFVVRTSAPGVKVSWRVEATRNDRWVQHYGAPVEVDKPEGERGGYQHPELYGQPANRTSALPVAPKRQ